MNARRWNWPLWSGLLLSIAAFVSYFLFFARFEITRDVPWVNLLLFVIAIALLILGIRRAQRKVVPAIVSALGFGIFVFFILVNYVAMRQFPPAAHAPQVGQKAPDFALLDTSHRLVSLSQLLSTAPRGVLLVFYRGYW